jgi:iron complex outermembrane receptor protein
MSGQDKAYAPHVSGNVSAQFTYPVESYEVGLRPIVYFTSKYFESATAADPTLQQSGYAKVDLRASFGPPGRNWEIALSGKNLTDKETAGFRLPVTLAPGTTEALVDPPRVVAIQFTIKGSP